MNGAAASLVRLASGFTGSIVRVLMPPLCLSCRAPVSEPRALCAPCWARLNFIEPPVCDRLGIPFPYDQGEGAISAAAIADPPPWDRARAAVIFEDLSRDLIHALKYHDRHEAGFTMGRMMARAGHELLVSTDWVVPVPLYRWRLWQRRYNQSALLSRHICRIAGKPMRPDLLVRVRPTVRQAGLDADGRRKNVRNAFEVPQSAKPEIKGRAITVVDDVLTTGATAAACARVFKSAGAARVDILAFALVPQPKRLHI